jgi:HSP20 family protein
MVTHNLTATTNDHDTFLELPHKLDQKGRAAILLDAYEADNVIEFFAEVPGVRESEIEINLEGDVLTLSVEKRGQNEGKRMHFSERTYGQFQRSIKLPFVPNPDSVEANVDNGVLVIRFPRVESERARRITVGAASSKTDEEPSAIGSTWNEKSAAEKPRTQAASSTKPAPPMTRPEGIGFAYNQAPLELTQPTSGTDKAGATAESKLLGDLKKLSQ